MDQEQYKQWNNNPNNEKFLRLLLNIYINLTMIGLPDILHEGGIKGREWYENNTISVDKNGVTHGIIEVGTGSLSDATLIVNSNGIVDTTTDV